MGLDFLLPISLFRPTAQSLRFQTCLTLGLDYVLPILLFGFRLCVAYLTSQSYTLSLRFQTCLPLSSDFVISNWETTLWPCYWLSFWEFLPDWIVWCFSRPVVISWFQIGRLITLPIVICCLFCWLLFYWPLFCFWEGKKRTRFLETWEGSPPTFPRNVYAQGGARYIKSTYMRVHTLGVYTHIFSRQD